MKKSKSKFKQHSTNEIRQQFLDFFAERDHKIVDSSPLVPVNDPTLLFTNAGMVQFKDVFLGAEKRGYKRAVSSQRCVRAGGKHNDLDNVGYTARHHTFFEMLGNFSFGDYFKQDAIRFAWELLTQVYAIPADKLWVTVYHTDDEAYDIWSKEIGVPKDRVIRIGDKPGGEPYQSDNFWQMADTGPCGPCSEIFYDHGADVAGGPPGSPDEDGDRYIEIWNLVFMQYDKSADGKLNSLPKPCVDTGMGLERLAAVLQNVHSNYDIDAFQHLIKAIAKLAKLKSANNSSVRVISDHIRSAAFLIADGVLPSNDGRGYVLRRIIRRAARHGNKLGLDQPFLHSLVAALIEEMGQAYPILSKHRKTIEQALLQEEERFGETLANGMKILDDCLAELEGKEIPGPVVFKLYDTYGFPVDLTADIARERELTLDMPGYELAMGQQRKQSQDASQFGVDHSVRISSDTDTDFQGYDKLETAGKVQAIYRDGQALEHLEAGENAWIVLDKTPFYAESGGQVGDQGELKNEKCVFTVNDTQKQGSTFIHIGSLQSGELKPGDQLTASVDKERRLATINNHSATHLLHAALRKTLGEHVQQKGSLVNSERLRFDFSHTQPLTGNEIAEIEKMVNQAIRENYKTVAAEMSMDEAMQQGALAFFGDKYGEKVRVLTMGEFSQELCGGTHVLRTGDIGLFKIIAESGIASGVRRIEALSGQGAWNWLKATELSLAKVADALKSNRDQVHDKINQLLERNRALEKNMHDFKSQQASEVGGSLLGKAVEISGIRVLAAELPDVDAKTLRETVDQIKSKLGSAAVILATVENGKVRLVAGVSHDQTARVRASDLVSSVAEKVGGKGGGRADMAQAGGTDPSKLSAALAAVPDWIRAKVNH